MDPTILFPDTYHESRIRALQQHYAVIFGEPQDNTECGVLVKGKWYPSMRAAMKGAGMGFHTVKKLHRRTRMEEVA